MITINKLLTILYQINHELHNLEKILKTEYQLLITVPINPIKLQSVTHEKSQKISTVAYYDIQRQKTENLYGLEVPYTSHAELYHLWMRIQDHTKDLYEQNQLNKIKLEAQMSYIRSLSGVVKKLVQGQALYCANGLSQENNHAGLRHLKVNA